MIVLKGKQEHPTFKFVQSKLDSLRVSYKTEASQSIPFIQDGNQIFQGEEVINTFLLELEKELAYWYYCSV